MAPKAKQKAKACEASKSRGGYNVDVLAECVEDVMTALVDEARKGEKTPNQRPAIRISDHESATNDPGLRFWSPIRTPPA